MSIEKGSIGTSVGRGPSMSVSRPSSSMGSETRSFSSFSTSKSGSMTEKGGSAMKMKFSSPMTRENGASFKSMPVLKTKTDVSPDRAMPAFSLKDTKPLYQSKAKEAHPLLSTTRPLKLENRFSNDVAKPASSLKETKLQYQKPKASPWKNTMELRVNKQTPAVKQADFQRKEKLPGLSAPSLFERRADANVKINYLEASQRIKAETKKPQTAWEKVQIGYALKKAEAQGQLKPVTTKEATKKPGQQSETPRVGKQMMQPRVLAPRTASELVQRAKDARLQIKDTEVKAKAQKLQQEYRKKFALPERQTQFVAKAENKMASLTQGKVTPETKSLKMPATSKDPVLARIEAEKVMEQAAAVLNAAAKFDEQTTTAIQTSKVGQERILQLVHETLQKRGLTQYLEQTKASPTQQFEQVQHAVLSPQQREAVHTQTELQTKTKGKSEIQPATQVKIAVAEQSKQKVQTLPSLETEQHITPEVMPEVQQEKSVATQTATKAQVNQSFSVASAQAIRSMPQEEVIQQLEEQLAVQTQTMTSGAVVVNQHVRVINGQYMVEKEEVVAERDPEADSERVRKAVEVGAHALSEASNQGIHSISSEDVAVRMPSSPIGGLVSKIRKQLNLPLDTEKQYDTFMQVLRGTSNSLSSPNEVQNVAQYATDVAPAVRLNTHLVTEPVKVEDHIRAVTDGKNIVVFEQHPSIAQAA